MFRRMLMIVPIAALAVGGSTACATKKFVRTSVGEVNDKVDSLGRSVEETQERTRAERRARSAKSISAPQAANQAAQAAQGAADKANEAAVAANNNATAVNAKADAIDKASKRLVYEVVLSEDQGNFKFGKKDLPDEAKAKLDEMITQIKADPKGAYFEIEGYTDSIGTPEVNEKLGLERAEAVKRYLYEQHQIPLHKMNVISYGEEQAGRREQDQGRPRAEPPRRDQGARLDVATTNLKSARQPAGCRAGFQACHNPLSMGIRTELTLRLPNSPGALAGVCRLLADERVNIVALSLACRRAVAPDRRQRRPRHGALRAQHIRWPSATCWWCRRRTARAARAAARARRATPASTWTTYTAAAAREAPRRSW